MASTNPKRLKTNEEAANSSTMEDQEIEFNFTSSDFSDVAKTKAFVDKSLLIKTIFQNTEMVLITAPHRFGKSTNIDMVKKYVEMQTDANGNLIDKYASANYQIFMGKKIFQDQTFFHEHFATYPVIYANFKCVGGSTFNEVLDTFRLMLHNTFNQYKYLLKSDKLNSGEIWTFNMYCDDISYRNLTRTDVKDGLNFLSECLYKHFGNKKVFVLIDEYDAPINNALFEEKIKIKEVNELLCMIFLYTLKENRYVGRALLTGISYFASIGLLEAYNTKKCMFLDNHPFVSYYGLTKDEVDELLSKFKICDKKEIDDVQSYYNGYNSKNGQNMFCLWSVLKYLQQRELKSYWELSGLAYFALQEALHAPVNQYAIEKLLQGCSVDFEIFDRITYYEIENLRNVVVEKDKQICKPDVFLNFLLQQGYLAYNAENKETRIVIPNFEIRDEFKKILNIMYSPCLDQDLAACAAVVDRICSLDLQVYQEFIKKFQNVVSKLSREIVDENKRIFYSQLFNVLCKTEFCVSADIGHYDSRHRPDLIMRKDQFGIIIQVMYKQDSKKALKQIIDKKYYTYFYHEEFKQITNKMYLGLNVSEDLIVSLSVLINSLEISEAKDYN